MKISTRCFVVMLERGADLYFWTGAKFALSPGEALRFETSGLADLARGSSEVYRAIPGMGPYRLVVASMRWEGLPA